MTVWVKESPGVLTADRLAPMLNANINLKTFRCHENVEHNDIFIISKHEQDTANNNIPCRMLIYEDILHNIAGSIYQEIVNKRDYYYLLNRMKKAQSTLIDTVITGSSHGLFGIDEHMLTHEVNVSMMSQDLYYSLKVFYKLWEDNPSIKNVVLCFGYYIPYSDLSKARDSSELQRISTVYEPIFADVHNAVLLPPRPSALLHSNIFDIKKCADVSIRAESMKPYFSQENPRAQSVCVTDMAGAVMDWMQLSEGEKERVAKNRVARHNSLLKYTESRRENSFFVSKIFIILYAKADTGTDGGNTGQQVLLRVFGAGV